MVFCFDKKVIRLIEKVKVWAKQLKEDVWALYYAYRDPRVPWYAKVLAIVVVAYAFSPIDLIPDFIPILGFLDDIILLPLGIWLSIQMIPKEVFVECKQKAKQMEKKDKPKNWWMAAFIFVLWFSLLSLLSIYLYQQYMK